MVQTLRSKKKRRSFAKPLFAVGVLALISAAGFLLRGDLSALLRPHSSPIPSPVRVQLPSQPMLKKPSPELLRGVIYDQRFKELAVSYRLSSLVIAPAEITDHAATAEALAHIVGKKPEELLEAIKSPRQSVVVLEDLDEQQSEQINALRLSGVLCKPVETRFYPGHAAASHVLGFMGDGVGLAGVEAKYDQVLRPKAFSNDSIPDIDFQGQPTLGKSSADLILTIDLALQRQLERRFREYLASQGVENGMGLVLEPATGRILALVNQPSFNPNYYWKASENNRVNRLYNHLLDQELIRPILARAAAIEREGVTGPPLPPETVAAPDFGFSSAMLDSFAHRIKLYEPVTGNWEHGGSAEAQQALEQRLTGVQVGVALASLVNGGWRIVPYVIDSLYDHATEKRYMRNSTATERSHVLDPALSVKVRRDLFSPWRLAQEDKVLYSAQRSVQGMQDGFVTTSRQQLFVGLIPAQKPQYLLVMAAEKQEHQPNPAIQAVESNPLQELGKELLSLISSLAPIASQDAHPPGPDQENLRQFLISKRLAMQKKPEQLISQEEKKMPSLRGLSLRKGLQAVNPYKMKVRVQGSGRIIAQYPLPGTPIMGVSECMLTLDQR